MPADCRCSKFFGKPNGSNPPKPQQSTLAFGKKGAKDAQTIKEEEDGEEIAAEETKHNGHSGSVGQDADMEDAATDVKIEASDTDSADNASDSMQHPLLYFTQNLVPYTFDIQSRSFTLTLCNYAQAKLQPPTQSQ